MAISQYGFPAPGSADEVVIATGTNFADALAGGPLAEARNAPVLLTDPGFLPAVVADEIVRLDPDRIVVLGGTAAVSQAVFDQRKRSRRTRFASQGATGISPASRSAPQASPLPIGHTSPRD